MGRRGPPPKPTALKLHQGNKGKRPLTTAEPKPPPGVPDCPGWLSAYAQEEWGRIVAELQLVPGLLTKVDRAALAAYCQAYAELRMATEILDREDRVVTEMTASGDARLRKHPAVALQRDAFARVKQFVTEFGLTPASRTRVQMETHDEGDDYDSYRRGGA